MKFPVKFKESDERFSADFGEITAISNGMPLPAQEKIVDIAENGAVDITPDDGYTLAKVTANVNIIPEIVRDTDLPFGYKRVDYIKFTGKELVDTGVACNQGSQIRCMFTREVSDGMCLYGVKTGARSDGGYYGGVSASLAQTGIWYFCNKGVGLTFHTNNWTVHSTVLDMYSITHSMGSRSVDCEYAFNTVESLILGGYRNADGTPSTSGRYIGKIFSFEIRSSWYSTQYVKLVPVVDSSGRYRFWDTVGKKFHDSITDTPLGGGNL